MTFIIINIGNTRKVADRTHIELVKFLETEGFTLDDPEEGLDKLIDFLNSDFVSGQSLVGVDLFVQDFKNSSWEKIYMGVNEDEKNISVFDKFKHHEWILNSLNSAADDEFHSDLGVYIGQDDLFSMFVRLSPEGTTPIIVAQVMGNRSGIINVLKESINQLLGFFLVVLLASIILSRGFVRKIVSPIKWLSQEAKKVAEGNREGQFNLKGRDEIARLSQAMDLMTENLSDRIELVEAQADQLREKERELKDNISRIQYQADALATMNSIDKAVLSSISRRDLLKRVTEITANLYPENGLTLLLKNIEKQAFDVMYERDWSFHKNGSNSPGSISFDEFPEDIIKRMETANVVDLKDIGVPEVKGVRIPEGTTSVLNLPLYVVDDYYGSLVVTSDLPEGFTEEDIDVLAKISDQIGVALQSLLQVEARERLMLGSLQALSAAIDAKSTWTAGHSSRVRDYALMIADKLNLDEKMRNRLSISAILHDIGKLGISEQILDKPGKLTDDEYDIIKSHPDLGGEIFSKIPDYPEVTGGIVHHHEQWSGNGYPQGLVGKNIPLLGRIICIADVYDAITADRPYRKGMTQTEAVNFLIQQRGQMFEPELTDYFLEALAEKGIYIVEEHDHNLLISED